MNHPLIVKASPHSVGKTADILAQLLEKKNIRIFARINHAEAARDSQLSMQDEEVIIFGDPKVGTGLMQECPAIGIELPLKILIWQDKQTLIGYRDPEHLLSEYRVTEHKAVVEKMSGLMASLVEAVANTPYIYLENRSASS